MSHHHSTHSNDGGRLCTLAFPSSSRSSAPSPWKIPLTPACTWHLHFTVYSTSSPSNLKNSTTSPQALLLLLGHSLSFLIGLLTKLWKLTLFVSNPQTNFLLIMNRVLTDMGNYSLSQSESSSSVPCANSLVSLDQHIGSLFLPSPTHFGMAFTLLIVSFSSWLKPGPTLLGRPLGSCSSGNAHIAKTSVCFLYLYDHSLPSPSYDQYILIVTNAFCLQCRKSASGFMCRSS